MLNIIFVTIKNDQLLNINFWYEPIYIFELRAPHLIDVISCALNMNIFVWLWYEPMVCQSEYSC
jgi:hypothetical protein